MKIVIIILDCVLGTKGSSGSQGLSAVNGHKHMLFRKIPDAGLVGAWRTEEVLVDAGGAVGKLQHWSGDTIKGHMS